MAQTRLCITVTAPTMDALRARRDHLAGADLVELRLDAVDRPDVRGALEGRKTPVVVTCRPVWEGGGYQGPEAHRLRLLEQALELGAEYVDVEWRALSETFAGGRHRERIVVSRHDFDGIPGDLEDSVRAMRATGAGTVKVAVMAHRLRDCLDLGSRLRACGGQKIVLAMGEAGLVTRVLAGRFGSAWTYAGDAASAAPGQVSATRMREEFRVEHLTSGAALYGVVGRPVAHSLSPVMHNAAFGALGMDAVYLPLAAESFEDFTAFAEAMDLAGASVTAPFKLQAFSWAGAIDEDGRDAGAVNTLRRREGRWEGCNTDAAGFMAPLRQATAVTGRRVTVLGAGGAARAVALALGRAGARVTVAARRAAQAAAVARTTGAAAGPWPPPPGSWDILVNATPVGMVPNVSQSPVAPEALGGGALVYDLVYNPPRTRLLAEAAARGSAVLGGLDMLVAQAAAQFTWWTGAAAPAAVMRAAALAQLAETQTVCD